MAYHEALDFADEICRQTELFPDDYAFLGQHLNRVVVSMMTQLARIYGSSCVQHQVDSLNSVRVSIHECLPLLELSARRGLIEQEATEYLIEGLEGLHRQVMLMCDWE